MTTAIALFFPSTAECDKDVCWNHIGFCSVLRWRVFSLEARCGRKNYGFGMLWPWRQNIILSLALRFVHNITLLLKSFCYTIWYFNAEHPVATHAAKTLVLLFKVQPPSLLHTNHGGASHRDVHKNVSAKLDVEYHRVMLASPWHM